VVSRRFWESPTSPFSRRRGVFTDLIDHQLQDFHRRGEALAGLTVSEATIYGRYGYGISTLSESWSIGWRHTAFAREDEPKGRVAFVQPDDMRRRFPEIYRRATAGRPGAVQRPDADWDEILADKERHRNGASAFFHVVYEVDGDPEGYASCRLKGDNFVVHGLMAATDEAHAALWRYDRLRSNGRQLTTRKESAGW